MKALLFQNLGLKLVALLMAVALWRFVGTEQRSEMAFFVPLEVRGLRPDLVITEGEVDTVNVRVSGTRSQLAQLDSKQLAVHVDLGGVKPGLSKVLIARDQFSVPPGVEITRVTPAEVPITVDRLVTKVIEVDAVPVGVPAAGFRLVAEASRVEPRTVAVRVPESQSDGLTRIGTLPVELDGARAPFRQRVPVDRSDPRVRGSTPENVVAFIAIEEEWSEKTLEEVPIEIRNLSPGKSATVRPPTARITVRGPLTALGALGLGQVSVWVDAKGLEKGERSYPLAAQVPAAIERTHLDPVSARVLLDSASGATPVASGKKP